jgi:hypothetical protein
MRFRKETNYQTMSLEDAEAKAAMVCDVIFCSYHMQDADTPPPPLLPLCLSYIYLLTYSSPLPSLMHRTSAKKHYNAWINSMTPMTIN